MKTSLRLVVVALATATVSTVSAFSQALAVTFGQQEVDQNKFIAVAQPLAGNSYKLLLIEQISNQRPCWSESGSNPVKVEALLLQFDFTGICGRGLDSNGYSLRMAEQDFGLQYTLNLVNRDGDIQLVAISNKDPKAPPIVIGKTNGIADGFLKINLDPGWRFTKRTYNGKTLGHVYFTSDIALGATPETAPGGSSSKFKDVVNDVYAPEIDEAVTLGFVAGFNDNTFRPQATLTREQLVSLVVESLKRLPNVNITVPSQAASRPYPDVDASRWSAAKIQFARDNKIVSGYQDGTFRPEQPVTRAELVTVLRRAAEFGKTQRGLSAELTPKETPKTFSDTSTHWAAANISQMSGYCKVASPLNEVGNSFYPNQQARRNYAAAATLRMLNCVKAEQ
ncbi:DUF3747 domain-containing protein [Kamptonema formosum]|uniref:DUF3747 domain-containing protein n=1 Tax=Kamptonema formosum TaxID=331992 RepID=UPI00034B552A|nr:DUF3747 domain-containing protein [Oscillatoria sp. PCC 10802]